ncbi:hypothetical protein SAMN05421505_11967 [Sinosporangium album]|uniref:Sodium:proton antiporter n=1 Tax=Sinosporangium album TaxID=504805 RepID=A0A1G8E0N3_9ACTN|nr:DUF6328 family protein [Sinosporangium album]SDH63415.1 hypothetical protein SAMN05421505_11967 [Sinosporangium album]
MAQSTRIRLPSKQVTPAQAFQPSKSEIDTVEASAPASPSAPTQESSAQALNRGYAELLQEVRIGQTSVQALAGFLMALAFMPRFATITPTQRIIYVAALVTTMIAAALLTAPAPFHRIVYGRQLKKKLVKLASRLTLVGLVMLMVALGCALMLVLDVMGMTAAPYIVIVALFGFLVVWFVLPLWLRVRHGYRDET